FRSKAALHLLFIQLPVIGASLGQNGEGDDGESSPPEANQKKGKARGETGVGNTEPIGLEHKHKTDDLQQDAADVAVSVPFGAYPVLLILRGDFREIGIAENHPATIADGSHPETQDPQLQRIGGKIKKA